MKNILLSLFFLASAVSSFAQSASRAEMRGTTVNTTSNIVGLIAWKAEPNTIPTNVVFVKSYFGTNEDGGGGNFELMPTNGLTTNFGTVFKSALATRFWVRKMEDPFRYNVLWFGIPTRSVNFSNTMVDDTLKITNAIATVPDYGQLIFPGGTPLSMKGIIISNRNSLGLIGTANGDANSGFAARSSQLNYIGTNGGIFIRVINSRGIVFDGLDIGMNQPAVAGWTNWALVGIDFDQEISPSTVTAHITVRRCKIYQSNPSALNWSCIRGAFTGTDQVEDLNIEYNTFRGSLGSSADYTTYTDGSVGILKGGGGGGANAFDWFLKNNIWTAFATNVFQVNGSTYVEGGLSTAPDVGFYNGGGILNVSGHRSEHSGTFYQGENCLASSLLRNEIANDPTHGTNRATIVWNTGTSLTSIGNSWNNYTNQHIYQVAAASSPGLHSAGNRYPAFDANSISRLGLKNFKGDYGILHDVPTVGNLIGAAIYFYGQTFGIPTNLISWNTNDGVITIAGPLNTVAANIMLTTNGFFVSDAAGGSPFVKYGGAQYLMDLGAAGTTEWRMMADNGWMGRSDGKIGWAPGAISSSSTTYDTALYRYSAGVVGMTNYNVTNSGAQTLADYGVGTDSGNIRHRYNIGGNLGSTLTWQWVYLTNTSYLQRSASDIDFPIRYDRDVDVLKLGRTNGTVSVSGNLEVVGSFTVSTLVTPHIVVTSNTVESGTAAYWKADLLVSGSRYILTNQLTGNMVFAVTNVAGTTNNSVHFRFAADGSDRFVTNTVNSIGNTLPVLLHNGSAAASLSPLVWKVPANTFVEGDIDFQLFINGSATNHGFAITNIVTQ